MLSRRSAPAARRAGRIVAMFGLVLSGLLPAVAGAATDKIVVSEFMLRCADGRADAAFVELLADGPGQTFDAALGVRLLGPSGGLVADLPRSFASRAGTNWPDGTRFLITTSLFEPLTGVAPDTVFAAAPTAAAGSIVLYRTIGAGPSIQVLQRIDYSGSATFAHTPPVGRSAIRSAIGTYVWSSEPSPTRSDGVRATAPDCFSDPRRPIRITELATRCSSGDPEGGFVEVSALAPNQSLDADLALRAFDHAGVQLFDIPLGFGSAEGLAWPAGKPWLVGGATLLDANNRPPDLVWPAPLDTAGGRVVLHGLDAGGGEVVLSEAAYGPTEGFLVPSGTSLVWDAFAGRYVERSPATPTDFEGATHTPQACAPPSSVRIREILTSCSGEGLRESYIELIALGFGETRDSTLALELHDATGSLTSIVPAAFGPLAGTPWPASTSWLVATPEISNAGFATPDALLPLALDRVAGRIDLVRRLGGANGPREVVQTLRWGQGVPAPGPGQALARFTDTDYRVNGTPTPRTSTGKVLGCPAPADTAYSVVVAGFEVCVGCWDGSRRGQYVRLQLLAGTLLDTSFVLRVYDRDGVLLGTRSRLFAGATARRPPQAHSWLVTDPDFPSPVGVDAQLPAPLDTLAGTIEVVWVRNGAQRFASAFRYGVAPLGRVPAGYCVRTGEARFEYPTPTTFSGASRAIPGCHFNSSPQTGDPFLSEVFVGCFDQDTTYQYVELAGVDPSRATDPRLALRVFDEHHVLQETVGHVLPSSLPVSAPTAGLKLLIGGPSFATGSGLAPDRALTRSLAHAPGTLELVIDDPVTEVQATLQALPFVPGVTPIDGRSLILSSPGQPFSQSRDPVAVRLDGTAFPIPEGCKDTTGQVPMLLDKLALGCFDGDTRGQYIQLVTSGTGEDVTGAYGLRVLDHADRPLGEISPAFGTHVGPPLFPRSLLIGRSDPHDAVPVDAELTVPLDTLGGILTLVEHRASGDRIVWSHSYPPSDTRSFPMGSTRQLVASAWAVGSPLMHTWFGQSGFLLGCHLGTGAVARVAVRGVLGACADGTLASSYVELVVTGVTSQLFGLEVHVRDGQGSMIVPLFPDARAFDQWTPGHSLLLASDSFEVATGVRPDRRLPRPFGIGDGAVEVRVSEPTSSSAVVTIVNEPVEFASRPEPGRALERVGTELAVTNSPRPFTFDGVSHPLPDTCFEQKGTDEAVQLASVMLACGNGDTNGQFVQVARTSVLATRTPDLGVRLFDHAGKSLGLQANLFAPGGVLWGANNDLVLGGPAFQSLYGFAPDAPLPAAMDPEAGAIQLVLASPAGEQVLSELRYGLGGVPTPPHGSGLTFAAGTWSPDTLPKPRGFRGAGTLPDECRKRCDAQRVQLSFGGAQTNLSGSADYTDSFSEVRYNLSQAEFDVISHFNHAELSMSATYSLAGALGPDTLEANVDVVETHGQLCNRNACPTSTRSLRVFVNDIEQDSLPATVTVHGRLTLRVPFDAEHPTRIRLLASADGLFSPDLPARIGGRLSFSRPASGAHVISCGGYDSEVARVVLGAIASVAIRAVEITWTVVAPPGFSATVQRLDEAGPPDDWRDLDTRSVEAPGVIRFVDHRAEARHHYRYRLSWSDEFGARTSDETSIEVPRPFAFGAIGATPNPSHGSLAFAFELAEPADVQLELFDLLGRRARELHGRFPAGTQQVALDGGTKLAPGMYQVRLRAGGHEAKLTVVVLP